MIPRLGVLLLFFTVVNSPLAFSTTFWGKTFRVDHGIPGDRWDAINPTLSARDIQNAGLAEDLQRMRSAELREKVAWVYRVTHRMIRPVNDSGDVWQSPARTLTRRAGDCEDFAILQVELLRWLNVPSSQLLVFTGLNRGTGHAVAAVSAPNGTWTLDILRGAYLSQRPRTFQPEVGFGRKGAWFYVMD